jgi:uncharacterized RDD family membrane protein YckC
MSAAGLTLRRLMAFVVDVALLAAILLPLAFVIGGVTVTGELTGPEVWQRIALTVSLPSWAYFIAGDALAGGRSIGKRLLGLRAMRVDGGDIGWLTALVRTALRLLPWELTHAAFFLLSTGFERVTPLQIGIAASTYALILVYLVVALRNGGGRSLPDLVAGTMVARVAPAAG